MTTLTRWLFTRIFITRASRAAICALLALGLIPIRGQRNFTGEIEIRQALERLGTLGSVMMIGAHPDDEREQVLAYLALGRHVRTAYLSLTRGEGGQNLIGPEQGDELGIIRSQELLTSRRIDGAEQYFTRAIDFGFSKTADETLQKWDRNKVLGDVVYNIRRFRPDVVILVFSGTPRDGHGHHQASSILGREAFSLAGDPTKFPEQLAYVQPWTPKRLMMNAGGPGGAAQNKGKGGKNKADDAPPADRLNLDVGVYSPELGASFGEIGGLSRSANRTQGTGAAEAKGSQMAPMETVAGDKATKDLFENFDITWNRVPGGAAIGEAVKQALDSFVPAHPEALLPALIKTRPLIAAIKDPLAERKLKELDELIALCSGLSLEAQSDKAAVSPGAALRVNFTAIQRLPGQVALTGIRLTGMEGAPTVNLAPTVLVNNQPSRYNASFTIPQNQPYTQPYWLEQPKDGALYSVPHPGDIGLPENAPALTAHFKVQVAGTEIELTRPVQYRYVDRVYGEQVRPFTVIPPVAVSLSEHAIVFGDAKPRRIEVAVRSNGGKAAGDLHLEVPTGWTAEPASRHFELTAAEEQTNVFFNLTPPAGESRGPSQGKLRAIAQVGSQTVSTGTEVIQYPHITTQTLLPPAEATLVRADIRILSKTVGYVMGAGDDVPQAIRQLGQEVTLLTDADLAHGDLSRFDAIVTGVRAFNTRPDLRANMQRLFDYASNGGTLIVQYNVPEGGAPPPGAPAGAPAATGTAPVAPPQAVPQAAPAPAVAAAGDGGLLAHIGPYPIRISRNDRVTVEDAPIAFPNPDLRLLHTPNQISSADFDGWVQERGLYFSDQWDPKYVSVLESHDPGEMPLPGGMLYAPVGKGAYIFSAYDWFRELPAGVPGAYRMFANMLSAAKAQ